MLFGKTKNFTNKVSFDVRSLEKGHQKYTYRGVPTIKCPFDLALYNKLIWDIKPDLIIEIGTNKGGSALYYGDILSLIGKGEVHTIDIEDKRLELVKQQKNIHFFLNGWQGYDLSNIKSFNTVLVIDDGSHQYTDVIGALNKFQSIVSLNSYFIVEDGILDHLGWKKKYNGGPNKAIKEFLSLTNEYVIDREYCDFFGINATFNTNGYLKKVK